MTEQFPFKAWDRLLDRPVLVTGWHPQIEGFLSIEPGYISDPRHITTCFPAWYERARQEMADAQDERATLEDVRYGG